MATPFPSSLNDRLLRGSWRDALPPHGPGLAQGRPFQVRSGSADGLGLRSLVESSQRAANALAPAVIPDVKVEGVAVASLLETHRCLDRLEAWVERHAEHLTWPSTQHGWADAVRNTIAGNDLDGMATLLGCFPRQVSWALKDQPLAPGNLEAWWRGQTTGLAASAKVLPESTPADPLVPLPSPTVEQPSVLPSTDAFKPALPSAPIEPTPSPSTASIVQRLPNADKVAARVTAVGETMPPTVSSPREPRPAVEKVPFQDPKVDETLVWLKTLVERLHDSEHSTAVQQEWLDDKLKNRPTHGGASPQVQKNWFEEQFFPAIARLEEPDLAVLLKHWPNHRRFTVASPVGLVNQPRFWSILKTAPDGVRTQLYEQALPRMVDMDKVSFDDRFAMAQHMLDWAKKNPEIFRQRLNLWTQWGGSVTEEEMLPSGSDNINADVFSAPAVVRRSVARWILEQGNDMWNGQLKELAVEHRWRLPEGVEPVISEATEDSSPSRRFRPRPR